MMGTAQEPKNFGPLIGAIDQGTSSSRFMVFTSSGKLDWAEQDPTELLESVIQCIDATVENLRKLEFDPQDIVAVGIANQRETTIVWDKETGKPVYKAILWHDVRTQEIVDKISNRLPRQPGVSKAYIQRLSGLPISTYFSALKLRWLFENVPETVTLAEQGRLLFGTVDTWLIWNLTGGLHMTDVTNASRN